MESLRIRLGLIRVSFNLHTFLITGRYFLLKQFFLMSVFMSICCKISLVFKKSVLYYILDLLFLALYNILSINVGLFRG